MTNELTSHQISEAVHAWQRLYWLFSQCLVLHPCLNSIEKMCRYPVYKHQYWGTWQEFQWPFLFKGGLLGRVRVHILLDITREIQVAEGKPLLPSH